MSESYVGDIVVMGAAGRMGRLIASLAAGEGLRLVGVLERPEFESHLVGYQCETGSDARAMFSMFPKASVIDFTSPESSLATAAVAQETGNPVVIGTTGFTAAQKDALQRMALESPLFWAPNMSVGVNVLLEILPQLTRLLGEGYDLEMMEIHHNKKKDAPSGTALRLAESMTEGRGWNLDEVACCKREGIVGERPHNEIGIQAIRGGDVAGVHTAYFIGQGERIEVTHHAHSRENFAHGALRAARWMQGRKPGKLYSMQDVLRDKANV
jgi:dihydrodipicolinate reductase